MGSYYQPHSGFPIRDHLEVHPKTPVWQMPGGSCPRSPLPHCFPISTAREILSNAQTSESPRIHFRSRNFVFRSQDHLNKASFGEHDVESKFFGALSMVTLQVKLQNEPRFHQRVVGKA
jgi:hypothetical protein